MPMMAGDELVASAIDQLRKELDVASELAKALNNLAEALRFFGDAMLGHTASLAALAERMPQFEVEFEEDDEDNGESWKYGEEE